MRCYFCDWNGRLKNTREKNRSISLLARNEDDVQENPRLARKGLHKTSASGEDH